MTPARPRIFLSRLKSLGNPVPAMAGLFIAIAAGLIFIGFAGAPKDSLRMEWAKALLDAGVVGIAGAFLAYLVEKHGREIESQQKRVEADRLRLSRQQESLKATLSRIRTSYHSSKRSRRNMRALARDCSKGTAVLDLVRYDEYMAELNDAQLEFEAIVSDVKSDKATYASAYTLLDTLTRMEKYLCEIVCEYEEKRSHAGRKASVIPLSELPKLFEFLSYANEDSLFKTEFSHGHRAAQEAILKDLYALTSMEAGRGADSRC